MAADLEAALGHSFADRSLLQIALTHRSLEAEDSSQTSNERLEFLGDAVLGLVIADELYERWEMDEGAMAKVRAAVVNETALAGVARRLGLGDHLRMGRGEARSGGADKPSILSDALEAVIGALFLDGGLEAARPFIVANWAQLVADRAMSPGRRDYKTRLQELLAQNGLVPSYSVEGSGPDHDRWFAATITVAGRVLGTGTGTSKKRAEQEAARVAIAAIRDSDA